MEHTDSTGRDGRGASAAAAEVETAGPVDAAGQQPDPQLRLRMRAREAAVRREAVRDAGERRVASVVPQIVALLHDRNRGVATAALWALGRIAPADAVVDVALLLTASSATVRQAAARTLGAIATPAALDALLGALPEADDSLVHALLAALERFPADTVVGRLVMLLHDPRGPLRARAARGLSQRPVESVRALVAALAGGSQDTAHAGDEDDALRFRRAAAAVLAASAAPLGAGITDGTADLETLAAAMLDALIDLSHSPDPRTRLYATRGLVQTAAAGAAATMERATTRLSALRDDERRDVAALARESLDGPARVRPASADEPDPAASATDPEYDTGISTAPEDQDPAVTRAAANLPLSLPPGQTYLLTMLPGLEEIAAAEVVERGGGKTRVTRRLEGALLVVLDGPSIVLDGLRTVLDATLFAGYLPARVDPESGPLAPRFRDTRSTRGAVTAIAAARPDLDLSVYIRVPRGTPPAYARLLRETATADLARAGARVSATNAALTADVVLHDGGALLGIGVRATPPGHRPLSRGGLPASINATLGAALVRLTAPDPGDVFLDPLCGAGTLLRERALAGPYARLLGGDRERHAVSLTRGNLEGTAGVTVERWDATALPLADSSVDKAAVNPPYGRRAGSHRGNETLYPALVRELARVVKPGGLVALVTTERRLTAALLRAQHAFAREGDLSVTTGGLQTTVYLLRRRGSGSARRLEQPDAMSHQEDTQTPDEEGQEGRPDALSSREAARVPEAQDLPADVAIEGVDGLS